MSGEQLLLVRLAKVESISSGERHAWIRLHVVDDGAITLRVSPGEARALGEFLEGEEVVLTITRRSP